MVTPTREFVSMAVDLSRLDKNPVAETQIGHSLAVGREVDLLETIRRSTKHEELTVELIRFHSALIGIDPGLFDTKLFPLFQELKVLRLVDDQKVVLSYTTTEQVYEYGLERIKQTNNDHELRFLAILVNTTRKPVPSPDFQEVIDLFPKPYRKALLNFVFENKILTTFDRRKESYIVSPRIYKDPSKFSTTLEILGDHHLDSITAFINENPGNPLPVVARKTSIDPSGIALMGQSGIIDPIRLEVQGDIKDYLFSANVLSSKEHKDHFDLVKMTLANFRFGEYYSKKKQLYNLDRFLEYMLEHGYAGHAEPIGTDYKNLELAGVFRIVPVSANEYRFWMLKRDVIEDARSILRGNIPFQSDLTVGDLSKIDNLIQTRRSIKIGPRTQDAFVKALREIQDGIMAR